MATDYFVPETNNNTTNANETMMDVSETAEALTGLVDLGAAGDFAEDVIDGAKEIFSDIAENVEDFVEEMTGEGSDEVVHTPAEDSAPQEGSGEATSEVPARPKSGFDRFVQAIVRLYKPAREVFQLITRLYDLLKFFYQEFQTFREA